MYRNWQTFRNPQIFVCVIRHVRVRGYGIHTLTVLLCSSCGSMSRYRRPECEGYHRWTTRYSVWVRILRGIPQPAQIFLAKVLMISSSILDSAKVLCLDVIIYNIKSNCCVAEYPAKAPTVQATTTNGGRCRFNPNIYAQGKVCL